MSGKYKNIVGALNRDEKVKETKRLCAWCKKWFQMMIKRRMLGARCFGLARQFH